MAHPPFIVASLYPPVSAAVNRWGVETGLPARMACRGPRAACWRSMGFPGRRAGEQAALGKADAVDQDDPEDEADQTRRHAEPPIEFWQIDRREHERRRQHQRDQHHSDDGAEP